MSATRAAFGSRREVISGPTSTGQPSTGFGRSSGHSAGLPTMRSTGFGSYFATRIRAGSVPRSCPRGDAALAECVPELRWRAGGGRERKPTSSVRTSARAYNMALHPTALSGSRAPRVSARPFDGPSGNRGTET